MNLKKASKQLLQYAVVGGIATVVEWITFYLLDQKLHLHYMLATALAFIVSTFANWLFGRIVMFKGIENVFKELVKVYLTSMTGLLFNLLIMWAAVERMDLNEIPAKIIATGSVFVWNFLIRKLVIYKT